MRKVTKAFSLLVAIVMIASGCCLPAYADKSSSELKNLNIGATTLISKLQNYYWGEIDSHAYLTFHIGTDNRMNFLFEDVHYPEDNYSVSLSYNVLSDGSISFIRNEDGYSYRITVTDSGFDNILLVKYTWIGENYSFNTLWFKQGGFSNGYDSYSDYDSILYRKCMNTYWFSPYLSKNYGVNFVFLEHSLYEEFGQRATIGTDKQLVKAYWGALFSAKSGLCLDLDFYGVYQIEDLMDTHIYLTSQDGKLYAFIQRQNSNSIIIEEWNKWYPDVPKKSWYYNSVKFVTDKGFMSGYADGRFGSVDNLKRQDFVVILAKIAGADLSKYQGKASKLKDVNKNAYYAAAVNWAVDNNIIAGYANGNFGVGDKITREQICTILYRFKGSPDVNVNASTFSRFSDSKYISSFARQALAWALEYNVISGKGNGKIAPTSFASRAEIAAIIMNMYENGMFE
ncbi:MAG: S-layer homology domain-containing protein [Clostridia bacterium]|nr:S-layer homology domain-containing protein [Clostridia bacterium]